MSALKLPAKIDALGVEITVRYARPDDLPDGAKGYWQTTGESSGEIVIRRGLPPVGEVIVLVHEILHAVDDMLKANGSTSRRTSHKWIEGAAFGVATLLIHLGVIEGLTPEMWAEFVETADEEDLSGAPRAEETADAR